MIESHQSCNQGYMDKRIKSQILNVKINEISLNYFKKLKLNEI